MSLSIVTQKLGSIRQFDKKLLDIWEGLLKWFSQLIKQYRYVGVLVGFLISIRKKKNNVTFAQMVAFYWLRGPILVDLIISPSLTPPFRLVLVVYSKLK